ncbi:hypothetical protein C1646_767416 [Rhizophagus diaphanus]|nr:hypothetical protein C1646_767416 [Rhizophagus diaphanus] [Rhizophagus sp. MUCL 43196]
MIIKLWEILGKFLVILYEHTQYISAKRSAKEVKEYLQYFLAHSTQKVYLNAQFKATSATLDEDGALLIADYKMRILPKSARETKAEFFGKRGWTLHTILMFRKKENCEELEIKAYDQIPHQEIFSGDIYQ